MLLEIEVRSLGLAEKSDENVGGVDGIGLMISHGLWFRNALLVILGVAYSIGLG